MNQIRTSGGRKLILSSGWFYKLQKFLLFGCRGCTRRQIIVKSEKYYIVY